MVAHTTSDSTLYRFNRLSRQWVEKTTGKVTFFLNNNEFRFFTDTTSYLIKGKIKPKSQNSIVMCVIREQSPRESQLTILAVRFSNEGDVQKLFALLAGTGKLLDRPSGMVEQGNSTLSPPAWFMSLGKAEQLNIKALAFNSSPEYINNRVVLNKLAPDYNLSPEQLSEAITYFHQSFSLQRNSTSWQYPRMSLSPSFSNGGQPITPVLLHAARNPSRRFDRRPSQSSNRFSWHSYSEMDRLGFYTKHNEQPARRSRLYAEMSKLQSKLQNVYSNPTGGIPAVHGRNSSRFMSSDARSARSPSLSLSVHHVQALHLGQEHDQPIPPLFSSHRSTGFLEPSGTLPLNADHYRYPTVETLVKVCGPKPAEMAGIAGGFSTPETNEKKCVTVPQTPQTDLPTISEAPQLRRSSFRQSPTSNHEPHRPQEQAEELVITSPLTKKNLALYNEQVPPLKGNYRKIVRSWFRKYFLPYADSNGLISGK